MDDGRTVNAPRFLAQIQSCSTHFHYPVFAVIFIKHESIFINYNNMFLLCIVEVHFIIHVDDSMSSIVYTIIIIRSNSREYSTQFVLLYCLKVYVMKTNYAWLYFRQRVN